MRPFTFMENAVMSIHTAPGSNHSPRHRKIAESFSLREQLLGTLVVFLLLLLAILMRSL